MGVQGLTTFLNQYFEKYNQRIYLRNCPVVIDGNNLMHHLYNSSGQNRPFLFGGDYIGYSKSVRLFFEHLKNCQIIPIVIFDGAYENSKVKTKLKRFSAELRANVQNKIPGKSYFPVLNTLLLLEILSELKIIHYQTELEADNTVAFIAKKLNAPILSCDSDFYIFDNLITISLDLIEFKRINIKKHLIEEGGESRPFMLTAKYIPIKKLCLKEFKINDLKFLSLAAAILGNDQISGNLFSKFYNNKGGVKPNKYERISYILKWLGKQDSIEKAINEMLLSLREQSREEVRGSINNIITSYSGTVGEENVWREIEKNEKIIEYLKKSSLKNLENENEDNTAAAEDINCDKLKNLSINEEDDGDEEEEDEENAEEEEEEIEELCAAFQLKKCALPNWYLDNHIKSKFPTPLLKIIYNKAAFLAPQVEIESLPNTHQVSLYIIRVIAGLLLGDQKELILITRERRQIAKTKVNTIGSLPIFGKLPSVIVININQEDFRSTLKLCDRINILLEIFGIKTEEEKTFISSFPPSLRIWIGILYYFSKRIEKTRAISLSVAILCCILKNFENSNSTKNIQIQNENEPSYSSQEELTMAQLFQLNINLNKIYQRFETVSDVRSKKFYKSYDISRVYEFCQFQCLIFYVSLLNRLLGFPLKPPKIDLLNSYLIYNILTNISENFGGNPLKFVAKFFPSTATATSTPTNGLGIIIKRILDFCPWIEIKGKVKKPKEKIVPNKNKKAALSGANRFSFLLENDSESEEINESVN